MRIIPQWVTVYCKKWVHQDFNGQDNCLVTDQVDASVSGNSRDGVHNKREINHGLQWERVLVTFRGGVISNDCNKFQGVQNRVPIGAHQKSAAKCSCWSVICRNKHKEITNPSTLSRTVIIAMTDNK